MAAGLAEDGVSFADYEVLVALSAAPESSLRAKELAAEVCWEKSRLSKHLARMAARGLVERLPVSEDARGILIKLTDEGRTAVESAAPNHVALVRKLFVDQVTPEEALALRSLTEKVVDAVERSADGNA
ncbi:hypothetical protein GCM10023318_52010 [Nocardia callitridis]|uniref:HTH marR-type domain-containing protein n=2 Tax=Nocardia callitridis TaxID=648753 RepID=A0ABP9KVP1_9NOCA